MIEWNEGLSLGVKILDDDHKKLLNMINEILSAIGSAEAKGEIEKKFINLERFTKEHCHQEELLLKDCNYIKLDNHVKLHKTFNSALVAIKNKFLTSKEPITAKEITIILADWFSNHIIEEDIPTIPIFEKCGLTKVDKSKCSLSSRLIKKITSAFSFTKRIFISAIIPLIGMLILIFIILWTSYDKHKEMKKTSSVTHILSNINELVHVMQIERGLSSGYISSSQDKFKESLDKQRKNVDLAIDSFNRKLSTINENKIMVIKSYIELFKRDMLTLNHFRKRVDEKEASQSITINFYSNIVKNILNITSKMTIFYLERDISSSISALSSLQHCKETLGLKRAYGTILIERGKNQTKEYIKFIELVGAKETFLNNFNQTSTLHQRNSLNLITNSDLAKKINLFENHIKNHNFKEIDSLIWFDSMTELINRLKLFEDQLLDEINIAIENRLESDIKNLLLWLIYTTLIFIVTLFIIYIFQQSSKREIYSFIDAMEHLAQGKRSLILSSTTKGEMAQMYAAYEITRQKLLKGDIYTQLYLMQKEKEIKEKEKENIELEEMASIDPLTTCLNRRKFGELSNLELERSIRYKNDLSFLMLDIDHFKAVNDTYGHGVGDEVLKHFSSICLEMARTLDVVARVGGEEFVVMLPETDSEGAYIFAERFREKIFNSQVTVEDQTIKYSVSIGISVLDAINDKEVKVILERADKALYRAKESGRNTTIIYKA